MDVLGMPGGRQLAAGSSMPRFLYDSRTLWAAQGWYGAFSAVAGRSDAERTAGAEGFFPVPPRPVPELASSQLPLAVLPACQTPVRSGLPSEARGTELFAEGLASPDALVCAVSQAGRKAIARIRETTKLGVISPPREAHFRRLPYP